MCEFSETSSKILIASREARATDDDLKDIGDALADGISTGKMAPRVATKTVNAVKEAMSKMGGRKAERKEVDNFYRLSKHAMAFQEGLQFWADQTMKPESREEAEYAMVVRNAAASIIRITPVWALMS